MNNQSAPIATLRLKPIAFALAALLGNTAMAQSSEPALSAEETANALETLIVKAQRRTEKLQDVPVVVKAFSAKQIEDISIKSTQDFINLTPNVSLDNQQEYNNSYMVIRGMTSFNGADLPVAVVVDGVPQGNQFQLKMNLFDIQGIEVLKGPQGALYGRNALGGAINIETKPPRNKFEGFVGTEISNGKTQEFSAGVGGAMVEDLVFFRLVGSTKSSAGLINNTYLNQNVDAIDHDHSLRARLSVNASETVKLDFRAASNDYRAGANWDSIVNPPGTKGSPDNIASPRSNILGKSWGSTDDLSFKADIETGVGVVTAITGYTHLKENYRGDLDFSNLSNLPGGFFGLGFQAGQGQSSDVKLLSQELRITSPANKPLRWIAGGYYLNTKRDNALRAFVDTNSQTEQWDNAAAVFVRRDESNNNTATAVFGQVDYDLLKDLTLSGALRFDRDERSQDDLNNRTNRSASYDAWQPKITLTKKYDSNTLTYATYSTGFRSGGFNAPGLPDFKAEHLKNYEVGAKTTLLDNRLILNGALFYSESKDFQYFYVDSVAGAPLIGSINEVAVKGLDFDFRYLPMRSLQFDGGVGLLDSRIKSNTVDPRTEGNYTPKAVPLKFNLGAQYKTRVTSNMDASVRLDWEHRSKKYWHPDNEAVSSAVNLINLRLGLNEAKDRWTVSLFARNLTNQEYYADYNASKYDGLVYGDKSPLDIGSLAQPRSFGLDAKFRF